MTTPTYTVPYRRKREGKTDYKKRLHLLKSRKPRLVIRITNTQFIAQIVTYNPEGDNVHVTITGKNLEEQGWEYATDSIPAGYLTGVLVAKAAKEHDISEAVLDIGLHTPHRGGKIFSALHGAIDGGLDIPANSDVFPSKERQRGAHIDETLATDFDEIKEELLS